MINADCIVSGVEINREEFTCMGQDTVGTTVWTVKGARRRSRHMNICVHSNKSHGMWKGRLEM